MCVCGVGVGGGGGGDRTIYQVMVKHRNQFCHSSGESGSTCSMCDTDTKILCFECFKMQNVLNNNLEKVLWG